jgi:hypothetical protein
MNRTVAFFFLVLNGCPVRTTRFTMTLSGFTDRTLQTNQVFDMKDTHPEVSPAGSDKRKGTTWHEAKNKNRRGRKHDGAVARCNRGDAFL